ncbi:Uncharacterised protein [Mycobacteroides abscessus subsp. abscessus]|nr:Uncharacterised protein [Mycobacteroides abscessus subsp. abscessus]
MVEVRVGIGERGLAQREKALHIPLLDVFDTRVDIDGEVEQIRDHQPRTGLQHIESLDDENVGLADTVQLARHDVVGDVRIDRCAHLLGAGFHLGDEPQQFAAVVALRESFAVHDAAAGEFGGGIEESIRCDQIHTRMVLPAREQGLQHARGGRFADRHTARHADHEGHLPIRVFLPEEGGGGREQALPRGDLEVDQSSEREVDLGDLLEVDLFAETAQADQLFLGEHQGSRFAQCSPLLAIEFHIGARLAHSCHLPDAPFRQTRTHAGSAL